MGNGRLVKNPSVGAQVFMEREFGEILAHQKKPHPVLFVPGTFLFDTVSSEARYYLKFLHFFNQPVLLSECRFKLMCGFNRDEPVRRVKSWYLRKKTI
jgi:hypothetical protein